jgi:hypothetical protein
MMKKVIALVFIAGMLLMQDAQGQELQKQLGFRFGNTTGFTAKFIRDDVFAFEGILGFRSGGAQLYGLFEARRPVFYDRVENMYAYFGGGLHVGFVRWDDYYGEYDPYYNPYHGNPYENIGPAFGFDGVIGMEYSFQSVPITLAADFKPFFEMYGPFLFRANFWDFGFHLRYNL